jgi:alpha-beta hydrolase superfamily lysophospholipase
MTVRLSPAFRRAFAALISTFTLVVTAAPVDAPELAAPGPHAVGLRRLTVDVSATPAADAPAAGRAQAETAPRKLDALLWYPATAASSGGARRLERELKNHPWRGWPAPALSMSVPSVAQPDATVAAGTARLPVVVISHGLLLWAEMLSDLAEHLASRGYVVLALQHDDESQADPLRAALALRPLEVAAALRAIERIDATTGDPLQGRLLINKIALLGYSMGGYGALVAAGARVATDGMAYGYAGAAAMAPHATPLRAAEAALRERVAAVVAFAPWGAQAGIGALKPAGVRSLAAPTLLVSGDQDDISGYADGTRSLWEAMAAAPRWLLTYENARHNIVQNAAPSGLPAGFRSWEAIEEPVWRRDRLLDINRHFVTAFLDLHLRGQNASEKWLQLATVRANDGVWNVPFGTPATGQFAGPAQGAITHWTGFQRRWALGLKLERLEQSAR